MKKTINRSRMKSIQRKQAIAKFKEFAKAYVVEEYITESPSEIHGDEIIDAFFDSETTGSKPSGVLRILLLENVKSAIKIALKAAIKDGVPGVLVIESYFDLTKEEQESVTEDKTARRYVAGLGSPQSVAGVKLIYGEQQADPFWIAQYNHRVNSTNGSINKTKEETIAAKEKRLAGFNGNSRLVKQNTGLTLMLAAQEGESQ